MLDIYWGNAFEGKRGGRPEKTCGEHLDGERRGGKKDDWLKSVLDCSAILRKFWPGQWGLLTPELPVREMDQYY